MKSGNPAQMLTKVRGVYCGVRRGRTTRRCGATMPTAVSMLLTTPTGSRSRRQTIAMMTGVNSHGMM